MTDEWKNTRSFTWSEKPYATIASSSLQAGETRKKVLKKPDALGDAVTSRWVFDVSYMNEKFNKSTFSKVSKTWNLEHKVAQLRAQLQTEELMMMSVMESFQETTGSERQAVISAHELAAVL